MYNKFINIFTAGENTFPKGSTFRCAAVHLIDGYTDILCLRHNHKPKNIIYRFHPRRVSYDVFALYFLSLFLIACSRFFFVTELSMKDITFFGRKRLSKKWDGYACTVPEKDVDGWMNEWMNGSSFGDRHRRE